MGLIPFLAWPPGSPGCYVSNKPGQASARIPACQLLRSVSGTVTSAGPALTTDKAHDPWSSLRQTSCSRYPSLGKAVSPES